MITKATDKDILAAANLAIIMWDSHTLNELCSTFKAAVNNPKAAIFIYTANDKAVGFAQCQLRTDYVEGTNSSPVGYLEGIFILPEHRKKGYAKELLLQCEQWAAEQGCKEFASDCELNNKSSYNFHINTGFDEANRIICFTKKI